MTGHAILIVEEDRNVMISVEKLTTRRKIRSEAVRHVEGALSMLNISKRRYPVVITDWRFNSNSGEEVVIAARKLGSQVIVMSGDEEEETRRMVLAAGANYFLPKPFTTENFYAAFLSCYAFYFDNFLKMQVERARKLAQDYGVAEV